jgi:predicted nucleic acid-binding protein
MLLIDSNILIHSLNLNSPKNRVAQDFLSSSDKQLFFTHQNILETIRVLTHHKNPTPFHPEKAVQAIDTLVGSKNILVLTPTRDTHILAFGLIAKYQITGLEIFDAYLVATALSYNVTTIATENTKHFEKYEEVTVFNPFLS